MLASKMFCSKAVKFQEKLMELNTNVYNFEIARYSILLDAYEYLSKNGKFIYSL